jgi:hypothetical protein
MLLDVINPILLYPESAGKTMDRQNRIERQAELGWGEIVLMTDRAIEVQTIGLYKIVCWRGVANHKGCQIYQIQFNDIYLIHT